MTCILPLVFAALCHADEPNLVLWSLVRDAEAIFNFLAESAERSSAAPALPALARELDFRHFCVIDGKGNAIFSMTVTETPDDPLPARIPNRLRPQMGEPATAFSEVMSDGKGRPTLYLTRRLGPDKFDDPEGVLVDGGRYYFSDSDNNRIVRYIVVLN